MSLIKWTKRPEVWEPFGEMGDFEETMNRWLSQTWPLAKAAKGAGVAEWLPAVDIADEKDRILIRADLPGMKQEEIDVEIGDGALTIHGERKQETETTKGQIYRLERSCGSFLRSFLIPANVDAGKATAQYKNGVLEIALPKVEEAKAKQVKVEVK